GVGPGRPPPSRGGWGRTSPPRCLQAGYEIPDRSILLDVPEYDCIRNLDQVLEGHPHRRRRFPHTPGDVDHVPRGADLDLLRDLPTGLQGGGERPLAAQLLELGIAGPAPPGLVAPCRGRDIERRVRGLEAAVRGEEYAPSALPGRVLFGAPGD